jgi:hypothetical protein
MLPFRSLSIPFNAGYHRNDPPETSLQHDVQLSPHVSTGFSIPYPSHKPSYPAHPGLTQAPLLPQSAAFSISMRKHRRTPPVPASETEVYRVPSSEYGSIHRIPPPTRSGLPVTPPDHVSAPQLPYSSQPQLPNSPRLQYVPVHMLPLSPAHAGPTFPADTQAPLKSKTSPNGGTKDVFQSLKKKRLPVAASFSRPKPRAFPVKKVLPKIHGCPTCGKMFDRPSTLLVVGIRFPCNNR